MGPPMKEITLLLRAAGTGDRQAADQVVALLYADLHRMAHSRLRRSGDAVVLDTTALVHESYLRLHQSSPMEFIDRQRFLGYVAKVMHTVVVDLVRTSQSERRGGQAVEVTLNTQVGDALAQGEDEILRVHEAMEELFAVDERLGHVVEMRYFAGLSESEIAEALGVTERTVQRDWQKARLVLSAVLK
jgi:RNA polymerase sigma factor (TIGR02999 family)